MVRWGKQGDGEATIVKMQQLAHEMLMTADVSELCADPAAFVAQLTGNGDQITIMRDGKPVATIWGYEPIEIHNWKQNGDGEWVEYTHDWAESRFRRIVQLDDLAAGFDALADDIETNGGGALIKSGDERVAELTPYGPSRLGHVRREDKLLDEYLKEVSDRIDAKRAAAAAAWGDER